LWKTKTFLPKYTGFVWKSPGKPGEVSTLSTKFSTCAQGKEKVKMTEKRKKAEKKGF